MGMFDCVNFKTTCPNCDAVVDGFQSKDGKCLMDTLEFWEVDNFYTFCPKCHTWMEYTRFREPTKAETVLFRLGIGKPKNYKLRVINESAYTVLKRTIRPIDRT